VHYLFRTMREFEVLRDSDALLEWAEVHGNCYATPRAPAEKRLLIPMVRRSPLHETPGHA